MPVDLPIYRQTKTSVTLELDEMQSSESATVRELFNAVVIEGDSYPHDQPLSHDEFAGYWLKGDAFVVRQRPEANTDQTGEIVGAFYIKPNFQGRCSHICNAGFIVAPTVRGQGVGRLMGEAMLGLARDRGYRAVMFNLIFATNVASLKLWDSLGFQKIGQIPAAALLPDGQYVDAVMLYKHLV